MARRCYPRIIMPWRDLGLCDHKHSPFHRTTMAKGKRKKTEETHLSKFIDQSNYEHVARTMKKRTMDFASLYESKSVYVLTDADEKHMREIEMHFT